MKIKRGIALALAILMFITSVPIDQNNKVLANETEQVWDGVTVQKPTMVGYEYQIDSAEELAWFAQEVNSGNTFEGKAIYITGDIDLDNQEWFVIGKGTADKPFEIDADIIIQNATIQGLKISDSQVAVKGLFGAVRVGNMRIDNLKLENVDISGTSQNYDGFLFGSVEMKRNCELDISNCKFSGEIAGNSHCGAVAGDVEAINRNAVMKITNCDLTISSTSYGMWWDGSKRNSSFKGGMIGRYNSVANTKVMLNGIKCDVDLAGYNEYGYDSTCVGGMIGVLEGIAKVYVYQCAVTGNIISSGYAGWAGGIVGNMNGCDTYKQSDCYVTTSISSSWNAYGYPYNAGGFLEGPYVQKSKGYIKNSYFAGESGSAVGFIAKDNASNENGFKIYNSYYDTDKVRNHEFHTNGHCYVINGTTVNCKGYTTKQMAEQNNYEDWDFENVWIMKDGYPELRMKDFTLPEDYEKADNVNDDSLNQFLDKVLTDKGNISTIKYLYQDENFTNSAFVYENDATFGANVTMLLTDMIYRGVDGWKDLFNGETSKQQAEEILAKLLYDFQDECKVISYAKTAQKFSATLRSGLEDFIQTSAVVDSLSNKDIKALNEVLSPQVLEEVFSEKKYNYLKDYLIKVSGYSEDDHTIKLLDSYLGSEELLEAYKDEVKYLGTGIEIISLTNDTIKKLYELDILYNSDELYSEMLLYIKDNCKYDIVCQAAEELYNVVAGAYKDQLQYVATTLKNKLDEKVVDFVIDTMLESTIAKMNYAFIIKEGFDWGVKLANWMFHTGEIQETRDKMRSLAYIGNCLAQWMIQSNIEYFKAETNIEKQELGLRTYYAVYMLWEIRKAGEETLQGFAELQSETIKRYYEISNSISKTLDSLKLTMFTEKNKAKLLTLAVSCPVDVEVTDSNGNFIAKILDGEEKEYTSDNIDYSVVYDLVSDDYIKIIRFDKDNDYQIKCYGNDLGQVDINLMEITDAGKFQIKYIDDISVDEKTIVELSPTLNDSQIVVNNSSEKTTYSLLKGDDVFIPLQEVALEKKNIEIGKGEKIKLNKIITPSNASDKMFYWESDNKSCVAVNSDGVVVGMAVGKATITISSLDGKITDVCEVVVKEAGSSKGDATSSGGNTSGSGSYAPSSETDSVDIGGSNASGSDINDKQDESNPKNLQYTITILSKELAAGTKVKLSISTKENIVDNTSVIWSSSNKAYATINKKGVVNCKKAGIGKKVTIIAKSAGGTKELASITFKIMKDAVTAVKIKKAPRTLKIGESVKLKAIVTTNGNVANTTLKWTSSNKKYATVNKNGKVIAKKAGKGKNVVITVASTDGSNKTARVKLKVK